MRNLRQSLVLPQVAATLVATAADWTVHVVISGPDARFNPAVAVLSAADVRSLLGGLQSARKRLQLLAGKQLPGSYSEPWGAPGTLALALSVEGGRATVVVEADSASHRFHRTLGVEHIDAWITELTTVPQRGSEMCASLKALEPRKKPGAPGPPPWPAMLETMLADPSRPWERLYREDWTGRTVAVRDQVFTVTYEEFEVPGWGAYPWVPTLVNAIGSGGLATLLPLGRTPSAGFFLRWAGVPGYRDGATTIRAHGGVPVAIRDGPLVLMDVLTAGVAAFASRFDSDSV